MIEHPASGPVGAIASLVAALSMWLLKEDLMLHALASIVAVIAGVASVALTVHHWNDKR